MIVNKVEITEAQIAAGNAVISTEKFTTASVVGALVRAGVTQEGYVAGRAGDRLVQAARRAGEISIAGRTWHRIKTKPKA